MPRPPSPRPLNKTATAAETLVTPSRVFLTTTVLPYLKERLDAALAATAAAASDESASAGGKRGGGVVRRAQKARRPSTTSTRRRCGCSRGRASGRCGDYDGEISPLPGSCLRCVASFPLLL